MHEGNEAELKRYMDESREQLQAEAKEIRQQAAQALQTSATMAIPVTNRQWLDWMAENDDEFQACLRSASQARRALNARKEARPEDFPAADRIYPAAPACRLVWAAPLLRSDPGFFCVQFGDSFLDKLVVYACSLKRQVWAFSLAEVEGEGRTYSFDTGTLLCQSLKPLEILLSDFGLEASTLAVKLYKLDMCKARVASGAVKLVVQGATPLETASPSVPDLDSDSDAGLSEPSSSDCESVLSDIESAAAASMNLCVYFCVFLAVPPVPPLRWFIYPQESTRTVRREMSLWMTGPRQSPKPWKRERNGAVWS